MAGTGLLEVKAAHESLAADFKIIGKAMPVNKGKSSDLVLRYLDQAVMSNLHALRKKVRSTEPYQTVRAGFLEGDELFVGTAFREKNHIQIAVRDRSCIKGYFLPRRAGEA